MITSDFIIRFFPGDGSSGSVRPLTAKGVQFVREHAHDKLDNAIAGKQSISELWTKSVTLGPFLLAAISDGLNFSVIQS